MTNDIDFGPFFLTIRLAVITTFLLLLITSPLAYYIANTKNRFKPLFESIIALPLVLPPSVIGFYLLLAFADGGFLGKPYHALFGRDLAFSFQGLVLGSMIYSMPFMINPLIAGFEGVDKNLKDAAKTLGKSTLRTFFSVEIPLIKSSLITGIVLAFAHTVGEFGVVLMIGGNIEGVTRVASIAIYDRVESFDFLGAHVYSLILFAFSFVTLFLVYRFNKKRVFQ